MTQDPGNQLSTPAPAAAPKRWLESLLRDFFLIVVGVLTALALENWNSARVDRHLEREYLEALAEDLRAHVAQYDRWLSTLARNRGWTTTIWGWALGAQPNQPADEVLLWVRLGGRINLSTRFQDGAYQDLVNSGRLSLVRNRELREALVTYNNDLARWAPIIESSDAISAERYSAAVDGIVPPEVAWSAANDGDLSKVELAPIMAAFRSRIEVRHALALMAESHRFRAGIAEDRKQRAIELLQRFEHELER